MARSPTRFTMLACTAVLGCGLMVVSACTSAPDGGTGSGGTTGSGSAGSGSASSSGGTSGGGPGSGGAASGGTSSGGTSSGGTSTGSNSSGGLGGETATGGTEASGGSPGVGGSTPSEVYVPCDADLGNENNPACSENEVCFSSVCSEVCPTVFEEALVYECPQPTTGDAEGRCQYVLGRCYLLCETQGGPSYTCPDGMVCNLGACAWPE